MLGLTKAWYGDYTGNVVPFNMGGGGADFNNYITIQETGNVDSLNYSEQSINLTDFSLMVFSTTHVPSSSRYCYIIIWDIKNDIIMVKGYSTSTSVGTIVVWEDEDDYTYSHVSIRYGTNGIENGHYNTYFQILPTKYRAFYTPNCGGTTDYYYRDSLRVDVGKISSTSAYHMCGAYLF